MADDIRLAIVGEYTPTFLPHVKTDEAIKHVENALALEVDAKWLSTAELEHDCDATLSQYDAVWVAPGSPYKSMDGALNAIRFSRQAGQPLLGTCGGCQHVIIEYARHVLGLSDAQHAEYDPYASNLFITPLSCSLVGQTMEVRIEPLSGMANIYGSTRVEERYYCNFGLNPQHQDALHQGGLRVVGVDSAGEARILTLESHPFFVATLFVPQLMSTFARAHPLILAFVRAAVAGRRSTLGVSIP